MKKRVRISEVVAVILCIVLIIMTAVVPQIFSDLTLKRMKSDIQTALDNIDNRSVCMEAFSDAERLCESREWLLCLVYSHVDVSDLQFAVQSAGVYLHNNSNDRERLTIELYRVKSCINTLIEIEQPTLQHLL